MHRYLRDLFSKLSLRQILLIAIPALTVLTWCILLVTFLHYQKGKMEGQYLRQMSFLFKSISDTNAAFVRLSDYSEIRRSLYNAHIEPPDAFLGIVDNSGFPIVASADWEASYLGLLKLWNQNPLSTSEFSIDVRISDPVSGHSYFVFQTPIVDVVGRGKTPLGKLVAFLDVKPFYQEWQNITKLIALVGFVLLSLLMICIYFTVRTVLRPLESLAANSLHNPEKFNVPSNRLMPKEVQKIASIIVQKEVAYQTGLKLNQVASQVAHDICSPLSSMQAALMMLRKQCGDNKDTKDYLDLLQLSSTRLEGISNGLLAKYKGEDAAARVFSIHEVLDELIGELRASPTGKGTEFIKHYHSSALYVSGDKTGISRAIGNIIKNALEAMGKNPGERAKQLSVSTSLESPPHPASGHLLPQGEGIIIRITDTGPGIPQDKIPLILQGGHTEGKADGHGIGTKVVRDVVDAHKGTLNIESDVGKGATFIITLPLTPPLEGGESEVTVPIPYSGTTPICVIDDEPSMREQWRLTLKALGADVETYTCWEDFSNALPPHPSPLPKGEGITTTFIIDYHFDNSEVDGIEVIRRLKARGFNNFILATAEYWKPAIKESAKELGITLCPKPLPKVVLANYPVPSGVIANPDGVKQSSEIAAPGSPGSQQAEIATSPEPALSAANGAPRNNKSGPSVLLIDDDEAIRMTWKAIKKILGVDKLTTYSNLEEMIDAATNPADYDMCVIDKNIKGSQYNGAKMLAHLKENGAKKVFLATGESRRQIEQDPAFSTIDGIITEKIPMSLEKYLPRSL